jgi:methionine sulfoxide reductase catalytic subunit
MQMHTKINGQNIPASEITPEPAYKQFTALSRRTLIVAGSGALAMGLSGSLAAKEEAKTAPIRNLKSNPNFALKDEQTTWEDATSYNNYYEFGLDKSDPKKSGQAFKAFPWNVEIAGECENPGTVTFADLIKGIALEERIYRHRCVEAWSMVLPWAGVPLASVLKKFKPTSKAKFVAFETLNDPKRMPGQQYPYLNWPYREGLRIDEAMNPLAFLATGMYGRLLPNQNGAPIRLVTPWKYGFKGIKGIVRIAFTEFQPRTSWSEATPDEYGFYANVNPKVDHPRWSQATERKITGDGFSLFRTKRVDTVMFNGYSDYVASLYSGMDLSKNY